jgi:hypothetical protein
LKIGGASISQKVREPALIFKFKEIKSLHCSLILLSR